MTSMGLTIVGAAGRMGRNLVQAIGEIENVHLSAAVERPDCADLGKMPVK